MGNNNFDIVLKDKSTTVTTDSITPPPFPHNKRGNKAKLLIIIGGALVVLGGAGAFLYYLINRDFKITPNSALFDSDGGIARFEIEGPDNWDILNTPKAWGSCYREGDYLCYALGENESFLRKDTIIIGNGRKSAKIIVTQESGAFYSNPSHAIAKNGGETIEYTIHGQDDWYIETGPQGWGAAYRNGNYLEWTVSENYGDERDDVVILKSGNKTLSVYITQAASLKAENMSISFSSGGGTKRIRIFGPDNWSCDASEYWLDVEREGDSVKIDCDNNDYDESREGTVTISGGGQTVEIQVSQSKKSSSYYYYNNGFNYWGW